MHLLIIPALGYAITFRSPVSEPPFTVSEALLAAVQNNPRVMAARRNIEAARFGRRAATALSNPQITIAPSVTGLGSDTELFIQQPLEVNGTRSARTGVAEARLVGVQAESVAVVQNLVFATRSAYYELVRAREQASLARSLLANAEAVDRLARKQVELGARPAIEQTQTGIEVVRARQQATRAEAEEKSRLAALNTLLGRDTDVPIGAVAVENFAHLPHNADDLVATALLNRPEIVAGSAAITGFRQEARLARAEGMPDLAPQYRATKVVRKFGESGFGIGLSLPLIDYGSRRNAIRQAETSANAEDERLTATRSQVRQEVTQAFLQAQAAESVLAAYPQGLVAQSQQLVDASRLGYEEGKTTILALLEAQRTFRQVQTDYVNAQVDYALARAELERATGAYPVADLWGTK